MDKAKLQAACREPALQKLLYEGRFGLRMEAHRVVTNGRASQYPFPKTLDRRGINPYLTSGVTDNLMEFNAVIMKEAKAAVRQLEILQQIVDRQLHETERLWPLSMAPAPVYLHDLTYLTDHTTKPGSVEFNHYLMQKYGPTRLLTGGVHVGYSLQEELIESLYERFGKAEHASLVAFKNYLYFKLAQGYIMWQWLFTYLFGASPVPEEAKAVLLPELDHQVRSFRNSQYGYGNLPTERLDYASLASYVTSLKGHLASGAYQSPHEVFAPVSLRGATDDIDATLAAGVDFISLRMFDLDPFAAAGISEDTLNFLELVMVYLLLTPQPDLTAADLQAAQARNEEVALQDPTEQTAWMKEEAQAFTQRLADFCEAYDAPRAYRLALKFVQRRIEDPSLTLAGQLLAKAEHGTFLSFGLKVANDRYSHLLQSGQTLSVIAAGYSPSVQRLIRAAILQGIQVWLNEDVAFEFGGQTVHVPADAELALPDGAAAYLKQLLPDL